MYGRDLPVRDEDLEARHDLSKGDASITSPLLHDLLVLREDDVRVLLA